LIDKGKLASEEASLPGIKAYLRGHPEEQEKSMNADTRYVFFKTAEGGARGVLDMLLTPFHSLATDPRVLPTGSLLYYVTPVPLLDSAGEVSGWREEAHFAVSQDIGEAIAGPLRADIYFGTGEAAAARAGQMMAKGRIYLLLLKTR
jgi:membrane-bound lytic murein transglycosylase A